MGCVANRETDFGFVFVSCVTCVSCVRAGEAKLHGRA